MMEVLQWMGTVLGWLVWLVLAFNVGYILIFVLAARLLPRRRYPKTAGYARMVLFVPCYRGDEVILDTLPKNLKVDYPADYFKIVVIADSLQPETVQALRKYPVEVVEVSFDKSTKVKSLRAVADQVPTEDYDYAVILDIDNVMDQNFLKEMNHACRSGLKILQGQRLALNLDTPTAWLDGISEEINNKIFRAGHYSLGLSTAFIGSGKALAYGFYKELINEMKAVGGFDKEMELWLSRHGERIHYVPEAKILDEKVQNAQNFEKQRRRWLSAQFHYFRINMLPATRRLLQSGNLDYFDKSVQMSLLPRLLVFGFTLFLGFLNLLLEIPPGRPYWYVLAGLLIGAILLALPAWAYSRQFFVALYHLPATFWRMLRASLSTRGANKSFIHTEHQVNKAKDHENRD